MVRRELCSVARWSVPSLRDGSKMQKLDRTRFPRAHASTCVNCSINALSTWVHDMRRWREVDLAKICCDFVRFWIFWWRYSVKDFSSKAEESINRLTEDRKDSLQGFRISILKGLKGYWLIYIDPLQFAARFFTLKYFWISSSKQ